MLSGKESVGELEAILEEAIKDNDWFLVGRLQARIEWAKKNKNKS